MWVDKMNFGKFLMVWDIGVNNILGRIRNIITFPIQIATLLGVYGIYFKLPTIIIASIILTGILVGLGWIYTESGLLAQETKERHNKTPQFKELIEITKRIEEKVCSK